MKKLTLLCAAAAASLTLTACVADGTQTTNGVNTAANVGMTVFQVAVDQKCRVELNNNRVWQTASTVLSAEQKAAKESQVCGCVSEKAPQQVTIVELTQAAMDPNYRNQIVATTVAKTFNACYSSFIK